MEPDRAPVSTPAFWDALYAAGQDGWDLGEPAPALADWLEGGGRFPAPGDGGQPSSSSRLFTCGGPEMAPALPPPRTTAFPVPSPPPVSAARVAVPGAGRGHDARLLARQG